MLREKNLHCIPSKQLLKNNFHSYSSAWPRLRSLIALIFEICLCIIVWGWQNTGIHLYGCRKTYAVQAKRTRLMDKYRQTDVRLWHFCHYHLSHKRLGWIKMRIKLWKHPSVTDCSLVFYHKFLSNYFKRHYSSI